MSAAGLHIGAIPLRQGYVEKFLIPLRDAGAISEAFPLVIKCVGDFGPADEAKKILGPKKAFGVGRLDTIRGPGGVEVNLRAFKPTDFPSANTAAQYFFSLVSDKWAQNPQIDAWETFNEDSANWGWQGEFYITMMNLVEGQPYKLVHYAFSSGNPPGPGPLPGGAGIDPRIIQEILPCALETAGRGHYFSVHEYGGIENEDGSMWNAAPFHTTRYRWLVKQLGDLGARPKIIVTECAPNAGFKFDGVESFMQNVAWYDAELMKDSTARGGPIVGGAFYTLDGGEWIEANFQEAIPNMAQHIITHPAPITPPADPCPGKPRTQYKRRYVLVEDGIPDKAEYYRVAGEHGNTVGPSADDAGLGDLKVKQAVVVQPNRWPGSDAGLINFYKTYYPGTQYFGLHISSPKELDAWLVANPM